MRAPLDLSVYFVTDPGAPGPVLDVACAAARGGARVIQLRDKDAPDAELEALAREMVRALTPLGAALIVNDRPAVARAAGAAGVHVGQGDGGVAAARAILGEGPVLGLSVEAPEHLAGLDRGAVDYVGAGPVRATATKPDHAPPIGLDGLAALCAAAPVPAVAIGGVKAADAAAARAAGAAGLAVVSAIARAADPEAAARALRAAWEAAAPPSPRGRAR